MKIDKRKRNVIEMIATRLAWTENDIRHCCLDMFGKAYHQIDNDEANQLIEYLREDPIPERGF